MGRSALCRFGLHGWDRIRDETARQFRTCRHCGSDRGRDPGGSAAVGRARALLLLLPTSAVVVGAVTVSWLITRR